MQLILVREDSAEGRTFGVLYIDGVFFCHTLEDMVRETKVPGETAIPAGRYHVIVSLSPRFKRPLPLLLAVPGFEGIRIHPGNSAGDTRGCILPGYTRGPNTVMQSRLAFDELFNRMVVATAQTWITIVNLSALKGLNP